MKNGFHFAIASLLRIVRCHLLHGRKEREEKRLHIYFSLSQARFAKRGDLCSTIFIPPRCRQRKASRACFFRVLGAHCILIPQMAAHFSEQPAKRGRRRLFVCPGKRKRRRKQASKSGWREKGKVKKRRQDKIK